MKKNLRLITGLILILAVYASSGFSQIPGGTQVPLNPKSIPQFVDPLPHFSGMRVDARDASKSNLTISYEPVQQVAVSKGTVLATGTVGVTPGAGIANFWGYSVSNGVDPAKPAHWPAFSIEAKRGVPVTVNYVNKLDGQDYSSVNLYQDQTIHWADPFMNGLMGNNMMNMDPYITGPIPVAPHLHGGEVASESDGGPDAWFTQRNTLPVLTGPSWGMGGTDKVDYRYKYPNTQEAATLWWHDHALGATRLNVYAGLAGFYFLRGPDEENDQLPGWTGDDLVQEVAPTGKTVFNPNPYLPEIEIVFQDRMFDTQGGLYFPNLPPNIMDHPFWTPEFLGDVITVNGKTWPYLSVAPRKYRFRLLNGSNARFYEIQLKDLVTGTIGPAIVQVGTDGGLMDAPVTIAGKLLLAPGERADVVIDFSKSPVNQVWTLTNSARAPYPKGSPPNGSTTGRIMQFIVNGRMVSAENTDNSGTDKSLVPASLRAPFIKLTDFTGKVAAGVVPTVKRQLTLNEVMGMGGPLEILVNNTKWDGNGMDKPGLGETELPTEGETELWQIINLTADAHPIHLHLVQFQIVSRQPFNVSNYNKAYALAFGGAYVPSVGPPAAYNTPNADGAIGGNPAVKPFLQNGLRPPLPNERGWKDTHVVMPGEVTTFIVRFAPTDKAIKEDLKDNLLVFPFDPSLGPGYVWHCHIIDHEDNEMMRPYKVLPHPSRPAPPPPSALKSTGGAYAKAGKAPVSMEKVSENIGKVLLGQNYPNPFSGETEIQFNLPEAAHVTVDLYNTVGTRMKTLLDADAPAGVNTIRVDAAGLSEGVYFYQLRTGLVTLVKRMVVQK